MTERMLKTQVHPDELLQSLLAKSPRADKAEKLVKLHEICSTLRSSLLHSVSDFSLSTLGRICKQKGLFKTERTLYNAASADYVSLIGAWASLSGPAATKVSKTEARIPKEHAYLEKIDDPVIRQIMQTIIAQRDKFKQQLDVLKSQTKFIVDQRPIEARSASTSLEPESLVLSENLTNSERNALSRAISHGFFDEQGWSLGDDGEVYSPTGAMIYEPGYESAVRKTIARTAPKRKQSS